METSYKDLTVLANATNDAKLKSFLREEYQKYCKNHNIKNIINAKATLDFWNTNIDFDADNMTATVL